MHLKRVKIFQSWTMYGVMADPCTGSPNQAHRKHFLSGTATGMAKAVTVGSGDPSARSAEKIFHLHFSVVWIGSRSTFVLCTALPRPYLAMGQRGATAPQKKLASE